MHGNGGRRYGNNSGDVWHMAVAHTIRIVLGHCRSCFWQHRACRYCELVWLRRDSVSRAATVAKSAVVPANGVSLLELVALIRDLSQTAANEMIGAADVVFICRDPADNTASAVHDLHLRTVSTCSI